MEKRQGRPEAARQTPRGAKFRSPAQPIGDFRGKAPSAYSELRFKLKLNVCKTIRRPRAAHKEGQFRTFFASGGQRFLVLRSFGPFYEMSRSDNQLFGRTHDDLLVASQDLDLVLQPRRDVLRFGCALLTPADFSLLFLQKRRSARDFTVSAVCR